MLYNAVIFDLDGTLTDSGEGIFACARYALEKMGRPVPDGDTLRKFIGPPLAESFMHFCGMDEDTAREATRLYRERYAPIGWKENTVYPGIRSLLKNLKKQGVYLAVATGKPEDMAVRILEYFDLAQYFDKIAGPNRGELHANKADLIRRVLPEGKKALMVGDTAGDVKGAKDTGIDSCAVLWGYGEEEALRKSCPTHVTREVTDLAQLLSCPREKGLFITLEGVDGCGKTTQLKLLSARLTQFGYPVHLTREPGGCQIAESIRQIVLSKEDGGMCPETEALLFAAARAQHVKQVILPKVQEGVVVLCDRFVDSSLVYQGMGRELPLAWVKEINRTALESGAPDMTLYLRLPREEALRRRNASSTPDRIEKAGDAFFARTETGFDKLAEENPERIVKIDAGGTPDEVAQRVWNAVWQKLKEA